METSRRFSIRLRNTEIQRLDKVCDDYNTSRNAIISYLVYKFLQKTPKQKEEICRKAKEPRYARQKRYNNTHIHDNTHKHLSYENGEVK